MDLMNVKVSSINLLQAKQQYSLLVDSLRAQQLDLQWSNGCKSI